MSVKSNQFMYPLNLPTNVDLRDRRWSVVSLLVANLLPLAGVLLLGWRAFDVVFLYWMENVVIGVINVLKMATCSIDPQMSEQQLLQLTEARLGKRPGTLTEEERDGVFMMNEGIGALGSKFFYVPFFAFHYGMFCFVHGVFVCVLLGNEGPLGGGMNPFGAAFEALSHVGILVAVFALAISHLVSFFTNYLGRGEYRQTTPVALMIEPYGRIMVLHMAIVFGAFLVTAFGSPVWLLVLLVVGKTWYDFKLHLRSHQKFTAPEALGAR